MAEVFSEFLGTDRIDLYIHGFDAAGAAGNLDVARHYDTVDQLRNEIIGARLWGGLHYRFSSEAGVDLGRKVADYGLNHAFEPAGRFSRGRRGRGGGRASLLTKIDPHAGDVGAIALVGWGEQSPSIWGSLFGTHNGDTRRQSRKLKTPL